MRTLLVIALHPFVRDLPYFIKALEEIGIQDLLPIGPVEAFDEGIMVGLLGLDVTDLDRILLGLLAHKDLSLIHISEPTRPY